MSEKNVILYTRVSSVEQKSGYSLSYQKDRLLEYARQKGFTVVKHYEEDKSGKNFTGRNEFKKLLRFIKSKPKSVDELLILRWDRFSRNVSASFAMIEKLKSYNVTVNAIEQPLDLSQPDSLILLSIYLSVPEVENRKNSIRTKNGLYKGMLSGAFMGIAPIGYKNTRNIEGKSTLAFDEHQAALIVEAFKRYAMNAYGAEEVRVYMIKQGLKKVSRNTFLNILKNPTYIGKIRIKATEKSPEKIVEGLHPSLIDDETFYKVQKIIKGKYKPQVRSFTEIDNELPLRGFLLCPDCGKSLTGSGSKGRGGKKSYFYYHCTRYCGYRIKAREVNPLFEKLLSEMKIEEDLKKVFNALLHQRISGGYDNKKATSDLLNHRKEELYVKLEKAEDSFYDGLIDAPTFSGMKSRLDKKMSDIDEKLKALQSKDPFFEKHLQKGVSLLGNISRIYKNGTIEIKKKLLNSLFPQKLMYNEHYFTTNELDEIIQLILFRDRKLNYLQFRPNHEKDDIAS